MNIRTSNTLWKKATLTLISLYWLFTAIHCYQIGNRPYDPTDSTSEAISIFAAKHFVQHGYFENYLFPTYPPFGEDLEGKSRTEPFVYDHYPPGGDFILSFWMQIMGPEANVWSARLIPVTFSSIAAYLFCTNAAVFFESSLAGFILMILLLAARSFAVWTICLFGHSYATATLLLYMSQLFRAKTENLSHQKIFGFSILAGYFVTFFALDWSFLTFFGATALGLFLGFNRRQLIAVIGGVATGGILIATYQVIIGSLYHHGVLNFLVYTKKWLTIRTENNPLLKHVIDHKLSAVFREFNRQTYGATGWTAVNLLVLGVGASLFAAYNRILSKPRLKSLIFSMLLAYLASAFWHIIMKSHAMGNLHFVLRHYFFLYISTCLVLLEVGCQIHNRIKKS